MTDPDEDYGDDTPQQQQQQQQQPQQPQQQRQRQPGQNGIDHDVIAGLDMNIGPIAAPSAVAPYVQPRVRGGPVAHFAWSQRQRSPPSPIDRIDDDEDADIDFAALAGVVGNDPDNEAIARAVASQTVLQQIAAAQPEELQIPPSNVDRIVSSILDPRPQPRHQLQLQQQQQREQLFRHREMITAILRECPNVRIHRLIRFILSIERYTLNTSRLRERLRQLERMLRMNRRTHSMLNVTVSHSTEFMRAFRRLVAGCSSARARRAFYALISRLREQVVHRLDELNQRRTRRVFTQPPQSPQSKGGKRKTKKMSTNRNKTMRMSQKK